MSDRKPTILHVDDDEANRYAVSRSLTRAGFDVVEAANGTDALRQAIHRPDLIILDVRLPDIDGFEVCRRIKSDPATANIPVLHLSASYVTGEDKAHGLDSGAEGYLVRPVEPVELLATVNALLRARHVEDQLRALNETLEQRVAERTATMAAYQRRLRSLVGELGRTEFRERRRVATELHDNLAQLLAVCKMKVAAIQASARRGSQAAKEAGAVKQFLGEAIAYTRTLMADLRPDVLNEHDLAAAVTWIAQRMERHGLKVQVDDDGRAKPLNEEVLGLLFESVRELLFNVVKHAGTDQATVTLRRGVREARVMVADAGVGCDPAKRAAAPSEEGGFGLFSIRERFNLIGGHVEVDSAEGAGMRVTLIAPLPAEGAPAREGGPVETGPGAAAI